MVILHQRSTRIHSAYCKLAISRSKVRVMRTTYPKRDQCTRTDDDRPATRATVLSLLMSRSKKVERMHEHT